MLRWIWVALFTVCFMSAFVQAQKKVDSTRVVIELNAFDEKMERSMHYWEARQNLEVKMDLFGFSGGKHIAKTFTLPYDFDEDAWVANLPLGLYQLNIHSLGFSDIKYPINIEKEIREKVNLKLDSVSYTYKNRKRYNYIQGTLNFNETVVVQFKDGDPAENRAFLTTALALEGLEHLNVLRTQKLRHMNAFLVTLDIADQTPLNLILYRKITNQPEIERGYLIGGVVTQALELFQANPNVAYANPSFLDDPTQKFRNSANYTQSEELERKLLTLMEEDQQTLDKINYIISKTTPKPPANEDN